jgi:hypothetical protein
MSETAVRKRDSNRDSNRDSERGSEAWLPFVYLTGPIAWGLQILIGYGLVPVSCVINTKLPVYIVVAAAGLVTLVAFFVAVRHWRRLSTHGGVSIVDLDEPVGTRAFVAISGAVICAIFFLAILVTGITELLQNPCPYITMPLP